MLDSAKLNRLKELELSDCKFPGAVSDLIGLEVLTLARVKSIDTKKITTIQGLRSLEINACKFSDLTGLDKINTLRELYLAQLPMETLNGIEVQTQIEVVRLSYMSKLCNISAMNGLTHLDELTCVACKKITSLGFALPRKLGGFICIDGGYITSLLPLSDCANLDTIDFTGTTNIADGKVAFLGGMTKLEELRFEDRKHYDCTWRTLQSKLKSKVRLRGRFKLNPTI